MTIDHMEIVIDIVRSTTGRLTGTLGTPGSQSTTRFDGTMELVASLEHLCAADEHQNRSDQC
jgi:hypothetical protein